MSSSLPTDTPNPLRIMVVEDERIVARDMQACLEGLGYVVPALVTSGEAAIAQAEALRPDLILMDIRLEGLLDGIQAATQIWDRWQIPVIYTTGYSDQATVERAAASAFFGYILKPVKERDLYLALQTAWQRQREREVSRQEREALVAQTRVSPILAALGDGVLVCDALGQVNFLNPVAEALTGWSLADAEGQHITDVFALMDLQTQIPLPSPMSVVLQTEQTAYLVDPVLLIRRDGQRIPVADSAAPLHDAQGRLSGVVIVFRDVTERELVKAFTLSQQRLELLQQEFSQLQTQHVEKEEFLQLVSHELRTPLASIKLAVHMLELNLDRHRHHAASLARGTETTDSPTSLTVSLTGSETGSETETVTANLQAERSARYLQILQTECDRELSLVNDLLELQSLEARVVIPVWATFDLQGWLPDLVLAYQERATSRQQTLRLALPETLPPLVSDAHILGGVVRELLTNACKYTPPAGTIMMSVTAADSSVQLAVSNTGTAIPAAELPRLFEKFYRVAGRDQWQQGGTGLGLALAKSQVERLGGTLSVTSDNTATVFCLTLPLEP